MKTLESLYAAENYLETLKDTKFANDYDCMSCMNLSMQLSKFQATNKAQHNLVLTEP
jgi:hypothetical protein